MPSPLFPFKSTKRGISEALDRKRSFIAPVLHTSVRSIKSKQRFSVACFEVSRDRQGTSSHYSTVICNSSSKFIPNMWHPYRRTDPLPTTIYAKAQAVSIAWSQSQGSVNAMHTLEFVVLSPTTAIPPLRDAGAKKKKHYGRMKASRPRFKKKTKRCRHQLPGQHHHHH